MRRPPVFSSALLRLSLLALSALLLSGCINDRASYQANGREQALVLSRDQAWFWQKTVEVAVVVSRLPECQRRHEMHPAAIKGFKVELWQPGSGTYVLRQGNTLYLTETQTCEGFRELEEDPPGGLGRMVGSFRQVSGKLAFVPEPAPTPVTEPAGASTGSAPAKATDSR
ncbi:MAG: hypothetical protein FWD77_00405 [Betaproteobacteria bacterium]|nr:hypothetical protein [Betaproteobacteria bacterium]